ncbi:hypothetical protein PVAP13_9NG553228 [Panicum virgatum]|uniref:Uncharacterized protein n=1 Tax=Panicum virgatum TaxID=38727 RepID=A0A8T0MZJ7_PANVG|nr:hypothetical protein PVAP13_9NG553228 [Panicum virgatum]
MDTNDLCVISEGWIGTSETQNAALKVKGKIRTKKGCPILLSDDVQVLKNHKLIAAQLIQPNSFPSVDIFNRCLTGMPNEDLHMS